MNLEKRKVPHRMAERYAEAARAADQPCVHGHFGCAMSPGGRCSDEYEHQHRADYPDCEECEQ